MFVFVAIAKESIKMWIILESKIILILLMPLPKQKIYKMQIQISLRIRLSKIFLPDKFFFHVHLFKISNIICYVTYELLILIFHYHML
jgi:hypothetical protein